MNGYVAVALSWHVRATTNHPHSSPIGRIFKTMSSIPLPALAVQPPQQQPNPIDQYGRILQLRSMLQNAPLQNQALQQQVQAGALNNQMTQQDLAARQAVSQA